MDAESPVALRFLLILALAAGAHGVVLGVRTISRAVLRTRVASRAKVVTLTAFTGSVLVFAIYFVALGLVLREFGISLAAYLASASIVGLAVSFGSQGLVQDVITGLTLVFSDLIDVGDMVEVAGQVGIVDSVGIRFTVLINFTGARVSIPNRTVTNVINYPRGYIRGFLDARLPDDPATHAEAEAALARVATAAFEQFPGIVFSPPTVVGREALSDGSAFVRVKFRIWPGQGLVLEGPVKQNAIRALRALDATYADWMVAVHYRAEPKGGDPAKRLPRPAALR